MLGLISETLGQAKLNIHDMVNRSAAIMRTPWWTRQPDTG